MFNQSTKLHLGISDCSKVRYSLFISIFIALLALTIAGCGSSGGSPEQTASISLVVGSPSVSGDGTSSVAITATVLDSSGSPVKAYTGVNFKTNFGKFKNGSQSIQVSTIDDTGTVAVSLISPAEPGVAEVTCESSGVTQLVQVNFSKTASINLTSESSSIPADGSSSVKITASVIESNGVPVVQNTQVTFTTTAGYFSNGKSSYTVATIDATGTVQVSLIAPSIPGIADVVCSSSGVTQSIQIYFTHHDNSGLPVGEAFGLSVQYHNISGLWLSGLSDNIYAYLGDENGNAVQDGIPVSFRTYNTGGSMDPDVAVTGGAVGDNTTIESGTAMSTLKSIPSPTPVEGMVSVTAETDGGASTRVTSIAVAPGVDSNIMYVGTNGGGVYKSTDSGRNWDNISKSSLNPRVGQNWIDPYIKGNSAIAIDPDNHNTVYVGTGYLSEGNIYRSLDGGMNWNSNNSEEWYGLYSTQGAVLTILCDDGGSDYVWAGTEGKGIVTAEDGENFAPGGVINVSTPSGRGEIVSPQLGYSAESETWTLTCIVPDATVNSPSAITGIDPIEIGENSDAPSPVLTSTANPEPNGRIGNFKTSTATKTETWTVKYLKGTTADVEMISVPKGGVTNITPKQFDTEETWTLTCIYVDIDKAQLLGDTSTLFSVKGSVSGTLDNANINTDYTSNFIDFKIIPGEVPFLVGDVIQFKTVPRVNQPYWQVSGSLSGMQSNVAHTGVAYTSDNGEIGFTIFEGNIPFVTGDYFTFSTYEARPAYWTVSGSISGMQAGIAQTNQVYQSDDDEIRFTIKEKNGAFQDGDKIVLQVSPNKVSHGWTVWDIVKVPGTHGSGAVLYAGTTVGVYKSVNGGKTWNSTGRFTGDYITCMTLYHTSSGADIIYAGTYDSSVWVSTDSGKNWTQYFAGIEQGTNIKDVMLDRSNMTLYALTWYAQNSTGKVYAHALDSDFTMSDGASWYETDEGLSGNGLYAIASDDSDNASVLFAGGDGINFYRTASGVSSAYPVWESSSTGLDNTIMARIPVLFSGEASMSYKYVRYDDIVFLSVYMQDINGNPPIAGSTFNVTYHNEAASQDYVWTDIVYPDSYTHQGTYRDPANGYTNYPYRYAVQVSSGDTITITYMLQCNGSDDRQQGCSGGGGEESVKLSF